MERDTGRVYCVQNGELIQVGTYDDGVVRRE